MLKLKSVSGYLLAATAVLVKRITEIRACRPLIDGCNSTLMECCDGSSLACDCVWFVEIVVEINVCNMPHFVRFEPAICWHILTATLYKIRLSVTGMVRRMQTNIDSPASAACRGVAAAISDPSVHKGARPESDSQQRTLRSDDDLPADDPAAIDSCSRSIWAMRHAFWCCTIPRLWNIPPHNRHTVFSASSNFLLDFTFLRAITSFFFASKLW